MPSYLYQYLLGIFEKNYIYHLIKEKCKFYLSYMNDLFLIWTRNLDKLHKFKAKINQVYPLIKFDFIIQATVEIS